MKTLLALLLLVAMAPDIVSAQPADWQKSWNETLAAARKEGKVVVAGAARRAGAASAAGGL